MGTRLLGRKLSGNSVISWVAVFALLFSMISSAVAQPVSAKSSRAALVTEVTGDVTYKKSGGSRSNAVYKDLKLNQGDYISVGSSGSLVLKIVDHEDEVTIGENSEVYISDLLDEGQGKVTKVKSWAGAMWSKVKSLVSSEDSFEVETPTAVMGVRGTNLFTNYDPKLSRTTMLVASGVVRASTISAAENQETGKSIQESQYATVYPAQQINLDPSTSTADLKTKVDYADTKSIVSTAPPRVLEAFIKSVPDIQKELDQQKEQLRQQLNQGIQKPDDASILLIRSLTDLNGVTKNFDALLPNLAKEALDARKLDQKTIDNANAGITDPAKRIDLTNVPQIDKKAGLDPAVEQLRQQTPPPALHQVLQEQRQLLELQQRLASLLQKVEQDKQRIDQQNKQSVKDITKAAADQFIAQLDPEAKKQFEDNQKKNEQSNMTPAPVTSVTPAAPEPGPSTSPSDSDEDSRPQSPTLLSPKAATVSASPVQVKLLAPSNTTIRVFNGDQEIGSAQGKDSQEVVISLTLMEGLYNNLTARSLLGGSSSVPVSFPVITVVAPAVPVLVSPLTDTAFDLGSIKVTAKAPVGNKILLLNGSQVLASADAQGDTPVEFKLPDITYSGLTLVSEKSGIRSAAKSVPNLTNEAPSVTLSQTSGVQADGTATFDLDMKNFPDAKPFYAVQAHLVYNSADWDYTAANNELSDVPETVFDGSHTAETLRQVPGADQKELIYAATQFETAALTPDNIKLGGSKLLVRFPLKKMSSSAGVPAVQLVYVKVVDKSGNVVYEK